VPEAHSGGVEFEISGSPAPGLELSLAGTVVNAEFDSTVVDGSDNVIGGLRTGNRLPSVPEYQLAATAAYYFPLQHFGTGNEGFVAASLQHVGSRFTQPSDQENNPRSFVSGLPFGGATGADATVVDLELEPYTTLNLNAGIENDVWALIVYVNNVTDENAELAFDRERGGRARLGFHVISPRTFGVTARRSF
jgi:iron complex outermembrane receptor protein